MVDNINKTIPFILKRGWQSEIQVQEWVGGFVLVALSQ